MTENLAQFPLPIIVFPLEKLSLHIFEPRYKQLIDDCNEQEITFGVTPFLDGILRPIGTEVELLEIAHAYPNGQLDIKCRGLGSFLNVRFIRQYHDRLYSGAEISRVITDMKGDTDLNNRIVELIAKLYQNMGINRQVPDPEIHGLSFKVGHHIGLNKQQEYELLCVVSERDRQLYIIKHLEVFIPKTEEMEALRERIQMNGHFRNIQPPLV